MIKTHQATTLCTPEPHPTPCLSGANLLPVQSTDLFKGQKTLVIEHNGACYRLQSTKLGKLILTK
jgi:hemin uptake protein HemP